MMRPSSKHWTLRLPNDDDDDNIEMETETIIAEKKLTRYFVYSVKSLIHGVKVTENKANYRVTLGSTTCYLCKKCIGFPTSN